MNKTNSDFICEYFMVPDPWRGSEVGIRYVFTTLLDSGGRNGNHGWYLQAESEARLILVCSIFPPPPPPNYWNGCHHRHPRCYRDVDAHVLGPFLPPTPPPQLNSSSRPISILKISAWRSCKPWRGVSHIQHQHINIKDSCITVGRPRMEPSKFIFLLNICCIASHDS